MSARQRRLLLEENQAAQEAARSAASNVPARARRRRRPGPTSTGLLGWSGLPEYLRDNEFIKGYYRRVDMTLWETVKSSLTFHNETMNIWTHAVGFLLFLGLTVYLARSPPTPLAFTAGQVESVWSRVRTQVHHLQHGAEALTHNLQHGAETLSHNLQHRAEVFGHNLQHSAEVLTHNLQHGAEALSHNLQHGAEAISHNLQHSAEALSHNLQHSAMAIGHNLWTMHPHVGASLASLLHDPVSRWPFYVFLAGAMTCLFLSSVCHLMGCCSKHVSQFMWRLDYSGIAILIVTSFYPEIWYTFLCDPQWRNFYLISTSIMGLATITVSLLEVFQSVRFRFFRAYIFMALGLWGIVPVIHQWFAYPDIWSVRIALKMDLLMGVCYVTGAAFYALRVPERWLPGKFDLFFASHQIFHVCVVLGALVHFRAITILLKWRDVSGGCLAPLLDKPPDVPWLVGNGSGGADVAMYGKDEVLEQVRQYALQHFGMAA